MESAAELNFKWHELSICGQQNELMQALGLRQAGASIRRFAGRSKPTKDNSPGASNSEVFSTVRLIVACNLSWALKVNPYLFQFNSQLLGNCYAAKVDVVQA